MWRTLRAARFLVKGPLILAMLVVVNLVTSPGHWWVQWAALGIGIAWVFALLRVAQAVALIGGLAALAAWLRGGRAAAAPYPPPAYPPPRGPAPPSSW